MFKVGEPKRHFKDRWLDFITLLPSTDLLHSLFSPLFHPIEAALGGEVTAQIFAPRKGLGEIVVGCVPAGVFEKCEGDARIHRILRVSACHCLILQKSIKLNFISNFYD